ncbi:MAG: hypothetical protein ABH883_09550, partial [Candidatus Omnitrophota bacterium]
GINYEYFFREAGYTLVVPSILFGAKSKEYGEEKKKYAGIFSLGSYDGRAAEESGGGGTRVTLKGLEGFLEKNGNNGKTAVILPYTDMDGLSRENLDKTLLSLMEKYPGVKFISVDVRGVNDGITGYERKLYRRDLYALLLLTLRLEERSGPVYEALSALIETRLTDGSGNSAAREAEEFINLLSASTREERQMILSRILSFIPSGRYVLPEYRGIAKVLMSA